ncbi:MAG: response regulator transcription factor, partial [Chloroflexi bacterium]|nr:response regulator transcription factor [Chloroflexota bacterium]
MKPIRIFLADDHSVLRAGLRALLEAEPDMRVVGEADEGASCIQQVVALQPDVVLLDINMPGVNGLEALKRLREQAPDSRVLILTMHDDAGYLRQALGLGGAGYVLKQAAGDELLMAIRTVHSGGVYLHPKHTQILLEQSLNQQKEDAAAPQTEKEARYRSLSRRESQIFKLVALGYRNNEIAEKLFLSVKTVETYKARLMQKLGVRSRVELVRYALELGILDD